MKDLGSRVKSYWQSSDYWTPYLIRFRRVRRLMTHKATAAW